MEKKYQVFISSTYEDLKEERQVVVESVLNAGHIPAGMELFKAGPTQEETIKEWIEESDIYILLLGSRYGSIKEFDSISYTEWEYNLAKELKKPMFSLVLSESYIERMVEDNRIKATQMEMSKAEYINFKQKVMKSLVKIINHSAEIRSGISDSLRDIEKKYLNQLEGWIRGNNLIELNKLKEENKNLSSKLVDRQDEVIEMQKDSVFKDNYVGEYDYAFLKEYLSKVFIDTSRLEFEFKKKTEEVNRQAREFGDEYVSGISKETVRKLKEYIDERLSSLDYLLKFKEKLFSDHITVNQSIENKIFKDEIISSWLQFSLVNKETIIDGKSKSRFSRKFDVVTLTDFGRKFLNIYENSKINK